MDQFLTHFKSPVGILKIVGNSKAVTKILFVDDTTMENQNAVVNQCKKELGEFFEKERTEFSVKIEPNGTSYQDKVWKKLCKIPFGKTVSYKKIAKQMGDENAVRAVASSNARNPIPIIIPCHRVIGADGSLTGYAGGLDKKKKLLMFEGSLPKELF